MAKYRFRLNGGSHTETTCDPKTKEPVDTVYVHGDEFESEHELDKIFSRTEKFVRLHREAEGEAPAADSNGIDVTNVTTAGLLGPFIKVFQNGPWYNVINTALHDVKINKKALRANQVDAFVKDLKAKFDAAEQDRNADAEAAAAASQDNSEAEAAAAASQE